MPLTNDFIKKRMSEMKVDVFPLDRLLPLETVYHNFHHEYAKHPNKGIFFRDRKFQRLREGYAGLFVAASLARIAKKQHYLIFPEKPDNDLYIVCRLGEGDELQTYEFDLKEFTEHSLSFEDFVRKKIAPRVEVYNIVIATYRPITGKDIQLLVDLLKKNGNPDRKIWLLAATTENDESIDVSSVTIIQHSGVYQEVINLNDCIDKTKPIVVFQDVVNVKYPSTPEKKNPLS